MKQMNVLRVAALLVLCCVLFGCTPEQQNGSIYGVITDSATGDPVNNATVQLRPGGETALTGSDGSYEFLEVPVGTYSIKVTKEGYSDLFDDYDIVVASGKPTRRDVKIRKLPSSLYICDNDNNEISELDFGANEGVTQKTFNIYNNGSQSLDYVITKSVNWISNVSEPTGTLKVHDTRPIIITIDRELLADGNNTTTLMITSSADGGKELTVKARKGGSDSDLVFEMFSANLMVQKEDLGYVDWSSARLLCENSTVAEYNDWRLPTKEELSAVYTKRDEIGGFVNGNYWSSSNVDQSWHFWVNFNNGALDYGGLSSTRCYVRAVRTINEGTVPTVTTATPTDVTAQSATCGGNVTLDGGTTVTKRGVCFATSQNPTTSSQCVESGTGTGSFACNITGLSANTKYYVRAFATNSKGTAYGEQKEFTTASPSPTTFEYAGTTYYVHPEVGTMTWQSALDYCNNLTFAGYSDWYLPSKDELNAMYVYRSTIGGFYNNYYWSSTASSTSFAWYQSFSDGSQSTNNKTNYYRVRPVRRDGGGPTPTPTAPTVTSSTPTNVTANSATCGGNVTSDGGANVAQRGVCYSISPNPTTSSQTISGGSGMGSFTCSLTGLSANTTYYVRAYAINSAGTAYGEQKNFTTGGGPTTATITLVAGDVWGDGTGYQMLFDKTHSLYGTIIPTDGALSASCSGNETLYSLFDYKIPVNADGNCTTQNIVINGTVSLTIPAGIYDWCITNPTPDDRIWIASSQGNVGGRQDDYEFEAGKTYEFTVTLVGQNDAVNVVISGGGKGKKTMGQSNEDCRRK